MPYISQVSCTFPPHYYDQATLMAELKKYWEKKYFNVERILEFQKNVLVGGRHMALPLEDFPHLKGLRDKNEAWLRVGLDMAEKAVSEVLLKAGLVPSDIGLLVSNSITGLAVPSLEARLMNRMPFSPRTKRLPLFGLGCLAGVAGINRVADYLKGHPQEAAVFFSIELCSLTIQLDDLSIANIISTGLFGDGGAAVLMVGDDHPLAKSSLFQWLASESVFFPDSERVMGWDIVDSGFKIILSKDVSEFSSQKIPPALETFLTSRHLTQEDLAFYVFHPGGPKILRSLEEVLHLSPKDLAPAWKGLAQYGNMSSVSVLFVLEEFFRNPPPNQSLGLMLAMGPAFCAELGLIKCQHYSHI